MAKLICDFCGGTIVMQSGGCCKCNECGMEYSMDAVREKVQNSRNTSQKDNISIIKTTTEQNGIDRDTLIAYIDDLRIMETIIYKSKLKKSGTNTEIESKWKEVNELKATRNKNVKIIENNKSYNDSKVQEYNSNSNYYVNAINSNKRKIIKISVIIPVIFVIISIFLEIKWLSSDEAFKGLFWVAFLSWLTSIIMYIFVKHNLEEKWIHEIRTKEEFMKNVEETEIKNNNLVTNQLKNIEIKTNVAKEFETKADKYIIALENDIDKTSELLTNAYDINIIPKQFRSIQGVYYLYNYLSTSHQTLSEALLQVNLEEIKKKLDTMIIFQSEMIIEQAQTNAKLGKVIEVANDISTNSAIGAQYSRISAINTEISNWLLLENLAYQKADFWLK